MELVKKLVQKAMPSLCHVEMDSLMARLKEIGVNGVEDLNFVKTEDVDGILAPIQCRRLIQAFTAGKIFFFPVFLSNAGCLRFINQRLYSQRFLRLK